MKRQKRLPFGVMYTFSGEIDILEDWLEGNTIGTFGYSFQGIAENGNGYKSLRVLFKFELAEDKKTFTQMIRGKSGGVPWQNIAASAGGGHDQRSVLR